MYLQQLYRHNKWMFVAIIVFMMGQLLNNLRQDIAISPFYSYGMYSEQMYPQCNYTVCKIVVNGKTLQAKDFTPQQWDNITLPLLRYSQQQVWNKQLWQQDIHRLMPFADSNRFTNNLYLQDFEAWYKTYLAHQLSQPINSLRATLTATPIKQITNSPYNHHSD
jgi:hypothetical protein